MHKVFAVAVLLALAGLGVPHIAGAQAASLDGAWSGGGTVTFGSGAKEQARCRVHYTRRSGDSYFARATCATASGRAVQTATLRQSGQNSYKGRFYNREYDISGAIFVVLRGARQSVRLTSRSGSAFLQLSR
jgi:hypothetical protein